MAIDDFEPGGVGQVNAGIFGLPHNEEESSIVLLPVPWDVTTSYMPGTHAGPQSILEASPQLDRHHADFPGFWKQGVHLKQNADGILERNHSLRKDAETVIAHLEAGKKPDAAHNALVKKINEGSAKVTAWLKKESLALLDKDKLVGVVGGDHSVPLGLMQALAEKNDDYGILHFDAHHDYRNAYMGLEESHASIMYNATKIPQISKLVQVGIRDFSRSEMEFARADRARLVTFYDQQLKEEQFLGGTWHDQCLDIIRHLPDRVYISFDIDGLAPHLCPNTGTPVPGGLEFAQAVYLIKLVAKAHKIIGFDLVEVAGDAHSIDANVGARLLWHLCGYSSISKRSHWVL
ncbi:MAG: agmatinase family protein [Alphaproteobacteria bacterium]|nr:agmatinase family protein [Alphaproteobacteria bacterium]